MQKELQNMLDLFPQFRGSILQLFNSDEDFRSLCFDYWQCKSVILCAREEAQSHLQTENEYINLSKELENEVLKILIRVEKRN